MTNRRQKVKASTLDKSKKLQGSLEWHKFRSDADEVGICEVYPCISVMVDMCYTRLAHGLMRSYSQPLMRVTRRQQTLIIRYKSIKHLMLK